MWCVEGLVFKGREGWKKGGDKITVCREEGFLVLQELETFIFLSKFTFVKVAEPRQKLQCF